MNAKPKVVELRHAAKIYGADIVAEVVTIGPHDASEWLKCNKQNRPQRKRHIRFLANEIRNGNWQVNGQPIVISDTEDVLDGQHRLLAVLESGMPITTLVVYGISEEAFKTIDTGIWRTGADALALRLQDQTQSVIRAVATAAQWCNRLDKKMISWNGRLSNTEVIEYVEQHPTLLQCASEIWSFPKEARPLPVGLGTALYEMFNRRHQSEASDFMRGLYTGETLIRTDPEWLLRHAFQKDADRMAKYSAEIKMRMVIKGWNWKRRGNREATRQVINVSASDPAKIEIY